MRFLILIHCSMNRRKLYIATYRHSLDKCIINRIYIDLDKKEIDLNRNYIQVELRFR